MKMACGILSSERSTERKFKMHKPTQPTTRRNQLHTIILSSDEPPTTTHDSNQTILETTILLNRSRDHKFQETEDSYLKQEERNQQDYIFQNVESYLDTTSPSSSSVCQIDSNRI